MRYGVPLLFSPKRRPEYLRRAFEELGPTYLKLGQIIASSPGLFAEAYVKEFNKCLDQVPSFAFEDVQRTIEEETGTALEDTFQHIDESPLAAASIAQVHVAILKSGEEVVVKVQRPNIAATVSSDLWFMHRQARLAEWLSKDARLGNVTGVIQDFESTIRQELDFTVEAKNIDEFNSIMGRHKMSDRAKAPVVYWDFSSTRMITMERFHGCKADSVEQIREAGVDPEAWLKTGLKAWMLTTMLHGFFHGDVHAGNLMCLPETGQVGFIDFGIVGRFDTRQRMMVLRYILSFSTEDFGELARLLAEMGATDENVDMAALEADLAEVYRPLLSSSLADLDYGRILPDLIANSRKHGIRMQQEFILILKQLLYFDRYAKLAAPTLNVFTDTSLVDFLFTPAAVESGIDLAQVGQLLQAVQKRRMAMQSDSE
jgi:predicted unusual protein kinase regulating ubiquinone biosynthesis (AarF/ABC1/UbiB family)